MSHISAAPGQKFGLLTVVIGDYEPENCRWATPVEQRRNRRSIVTV